MYLTKIINFLDSKKLPLYFAIIFVFFIVISIIFGQLNGWMNRIFVIKAFTFGPYTSTFEVRPGTTLIYSFLGLVICILLLFQDFISKIPPRAKLTILLFSLIPQSIWFYELLWHFFYWLNKGYNLTESYYFFHTKMNVVLVFSVLALQIMLLYDLKEPTQKSKR